MPLPPIVVTADRKDNGQTLAAVLKLRLGLTWSQAKRAIDRRHVRVGGQIVADATFRVKVGKRISVAGGVIEARSTSEARSTEREAGSEKPKAKKEAPFSREAKSSKPSAAGPAAKAKPEKRIPKVKSLSVGFDILFSDDAVVVVNKPAGITTVRSAEDAEEFGVGKKFLPKTLAELLPVTLGMPDRPVVAVHRLDRDTTGAIVFARNKAVGQKLMAQFRKHTTDRRYIALVRGEPKAGRIESTLVLDRGDGRRGTGEGEEAKKAVTYVKVIEQLGPFSLIECRLETGRTHQVRIHLGEAGTPLCGETVYDRPIHGQPLADDSAAKRPMLHAASLGFTHPVTNERLTYEVPPPADFAELLAKLRSAT